MNRRFLIRGLPFSLLVSFTFACATASAPALEGEADAGLINNNDAYGPGQDAALPDAAPVTATLSQLTSDTLVAETSVACANNGTRVHRENSWYRKWDLAAAGVVGDLVIESIDFGVETAASGNGANIPINVRVHTLVGNFETANLTQISASAVGVADQTLGKVNVPLVVTVPADSIMVIEVHAPDGEAAGHSFYIGANDLGQSQPTYIRAPATGCDFVQPLDLAAAGFPNSHAYITVSGTY